jgi:hypothetical protein
MRQKLQNEKEELEKIKKEKLGELQGLGISDKYTAELARKKIQ